MPLPPQSNASGITRTVCSRSVASNAKSIAIGQFARQEILRGCDVLAKAVGATLGPRGRNVIIEQTYGPPKITKDGVTVAKSIDLTDNLQNIGASLIKGVAQATNDASGDGTTTATVLAKEIFKGGCEAVAAGLKPIEILKGIKLATEAIISHLLKNARPVAEAEDIFHVAKVSANGDDTIGKLISSAMEKVGQDGTITLSEGKKLNHELTIVEGYEFDRGFIAPYFITQPRTQKCEMENPYVLLCDERINNLQSLIPILEGVIQANGELLIIAEDVESEALATLVVNKLRGGLKVCAVKAPGFGDNRKRQLEDLAVLTGGVVASREQGIKLDSITVNQLGRVKRAIIGKDSTLLLEGNSTPKAVKERVETIKFQLAQPDMSEYERSKLQERVGKLVGGVAVIQVGGASELEVGEAKDRLNDALCATRAAVESGVLPGGGTALLFAAEALRDLQGENLDQNTGIRIVRQACAAPCKLIANNAGYEGSVVAGNLVRDHKFGEGFDANTGEYVDMFKQGILDPAKVVKTALNDAASVAALMCTTEAAIFSPKEKQAPHDASNFDM